MMRMSQGVRTLRGSKRVGAISIALLVAGASGCNFGVDPFAADSGGVGGDDGGDGGAADDGAADDAPGDDGGPGGEGGGGSGADDGDDAADTGAADSGGPGTGGAESGGAEELCLPAPTRLIVFGDSIFACFGVGGKNSDNCAPKIVSDYFAENYGPVSYENLAVNGDRTKHVPDDQMPNMAVGPGHALVLIFIGGNDLAQYIFVSDDEAASGWDTTAPEVAQKWDEIFAFLEDPANFPDGVTVVMNTQYNPFDDCTAPPYESVTPFKTMLLHDHNDLLRARADAHDYAYMVDQHPSYLGHGHHYDDSACPHFAEGAGGWMFDIIHPNAEGHRNIATEIEAVIDTLYAGCE